MYTVTSRPLVSRTLATFRSAEFGFLGVVVYTRRQTPRFWGHESSAGELLLLATTDRPFRTSWLIVGIHFPSGFLSSIPIDRTVIYNNSLPCCQRISCPRTLPERQRRRYLPSSSSFGNSGSGSGKGGA